MTRPVNLSDAQRDVLLELGQLMGERTSVEEVFAAFAARILEVEDFDYTNLFVTEPDARWARIVGSYPAYEPASGAQPRILSKELGLEQLAEVPEGVEYAPETVDIPGAQVLARVGLRRAWAGALVVDGHIYGAYTVARGSAQPFTPGALAFLRAASSILALAVRDDVRVRQLRQQAERSALLNELALMFNAGDPLDPLFDHFAALLRGVLEFDFFALSVLERDLQWRLVGSWPAMGEPPAPPFEASEVDVSAILATGKRVVEYRTRRTGGYWSDAMAAAGTERAAVSLLRAEGETIGAIAFGRKSKLPFHADDVAFIEVVCTMVEQAVRNHRRSQQAAATAARSQLLNELALLLTAGESIDALWERMLALIERALSFEYIGLLEVTDTAGELRQVGSRPELVRPRGARTTIAAAAIEPMFEFRGVIQYRNDRITVGTAPVLLAAGIIRVAAVILRHGGEVMGELAVGRSRNTAYTPDECEFLETVANLLGQAVANQQRIRRIEQEAARGALLNELSMLLNAGEPVGALFDRLPRLLRRAVEFDYVSLAVIEEDGQINAIDWNFRDPDNVHRSSLTLAAVGMARLAASPYVVNEFSLRTGISAVQDSLYAAGLRRSVITPLHHGQWTLGALHISRATLTPFHPEERAFLEVVSRLFTQAVANELRIVASDTEAAEQGILASVGTVVAHQSNPRAIVKALGEPLSRFIEGAIVVFAYIEGDGARFVGPSDGQRRMPIGDRIREALDCGQAVGAPSEHVAGVELRTEAERLGIGANIITVAYSAGVAVGVLIVAVPDPAYVFSAAQTGLLSRVAQLIGPAMAHADVAEKIATEAQEQRILAEVAAAAASESEPAALLQAVVGPLRAFVSKPLVGFGHIEGGLAIYHIPGEGELGLPATDLEAEAIHTGQAAVRHIEEHAPPGHHVHGRGVHAAVLTAFQSGGAAAGLFIVGSRDPAFVFGERDRRIFRLMAQIVGPAMEAARAARRTREEAEEQRIIAEVGAIIARETESDALLRACEAPIARRVPDPVCTYAFLDLEHDSYTFGDPSDDGWRIGSLGRIAIVSGQAHGSVDMLDEPNPARAAGLEAISLTAHYSGGVAAGLLGVASRRAGHTFRDSDLRLFRQLSAIIAPAMEALRSSALAARQAALYNLILSSLSEAVLLLDADLRVVFANAKGTRLVDLVDPARKLTTLDEHLPMLPRHVGEDLGRAVLQGQPGRGRAKFELDGAPAYYDYEIVPLGDASGRLLIVASDATAQARSEIEQEEHRDQMAQASRLAALGELIGGVAHELNNPLTAILGFAEVLALSEAGSAVGEELSIIQKEALRARNIVRDLLFISRPGPVERGPVAISEVIAHIERLRRTAWQQQGIDVHVAVEAEGTELWGNENQLTQVLLNLVTNAEHAVADGNAPSIHIEAGPNAQGETVIEVRDNGVGMDDATAQRVFEPFYTTKQGQGTGLGLSMSYSIVAAHDGRIEVESARGRGSLFRVTLPSHRPPAPPVAIEPPLVAAPPARVLVIDDEPSLRKVCKRLITSMGHECAVADGSVSAAALAAQGEFDLVLCDYRLAGETADDVLPALAAIDPRLVARIVIATGAVTDPGVSLLTRRHNLRLVAKPYGFDEIAELISNLPRERAS